MVKDVEAANEKNNGSDVEPDNGAQSSSDAGESLTTKDNLSSNDDLSANDDLSTSEKKKSETQRHTDVAPGKSSFASMMAIAALLLSLGAGGTAYTIWSQSEQRLAALDTALAELRQYADAQVKQLSSDDRSLESKLNSSLAESAQKLSTALTEGEQSEKSIRTEIKHLSDSTTALSDRMGRDSTLWIIAEAEYLLTVANHRLTLVQDVGTAIAALTAADQRLKEVGDPGLLKVRRVITEEIISLRSVELPDITGMALELASLASTAEQLPLIVKQRQEQFESTFSATDAAKNQAEDVSGVMQAVWKDLKSLVVIRKNDKPVDALLAPDQRHFLYQNLILKLETGRLALLRGEEKNLKASLDVAQKWLKGYFDQQTTAYKNFESTIARISASNLTPEIPDISNSLKVLRQYRASKGLAQVTTTPNKKVKITVPAKPPVKQKVSVNEQITPPVQPQSQDSQAVDPIPAESTEVNP